MSISENLQLIQTLVTTAVNLGVSDFAEVADRSLLLFFVKYYNDTAAGKTMKDGKAMLSEE